MYRTGDPEGQWLISGVLRGGRRGSEDGYGNIYIKWKDGGMGKERFCQIGIRTHMAREKEFWDVEPVNKTPISMRNLCTPMDGHYDMLYVHTYRGRVIRGHPLVMMEHRWRTEIWP